MGQHQSTTTTTTTTTTSPSLTPPGNSNSNNGDSNGHSQHHHHPHPHPHRGVSSPGGGGGGGGPSAQQQPQLKLQSPQSPPPRGSSNGAWTNGSLRSIPPPDKPSAERFTATIERVGVHPELLEPPPPPPPPPQNQSQPSRRRQQRQGPSSSSLASPSGPSSSSSTGWLDSTANGVRPAPTTSASGSSSMWLYAPSPSSPPRTTTATTTSSLTATSRNSTPRRRRRSTMTERLRTLRCIAYSPRHHNQQPPREDEDQHQHQHEREQQQPQLVQPEAPPPPPPPQQQQQQQQQNHNHGHYGVPESLVLSEVQQSTPLLSLPSSPPSQRPPPQNHSHGHDGSPESPSAGGRPLSASAWQPLTSSPPQRPPPKASSSSSSSSPPVEWNGSSRTTTTTSAAARPLPNGQPPLPKRFQEEEEAEQLPKFGSASPQPKTPTAAHSMMNKGDSSSSNSNNNKNNNNNTTHNQKKMKNNSNLTEEDGHDGNPNGPHDQQQQQQQQPQRLEEKHGPPKRAAKHYVSASASASTSWAPPKNRRLLQLEPSQQVVEPSPTTTTTTTTTHDEPLSVAVASPHDEKLPRSPPHVMEEENDNNNNNEEEEEEELPPLHNMEEEEDDDDDDTTDEPQEEDEEDGAEWNSLVSPPRTATQQQQQQQQERPRQLRHMILSSSSSSSSSSTNNHANHHHPSQPPTRRQQQEQVPTGRGLVRPSAPPPPEPSPTSEREQPRRRVGGGGNGSGNGGARHYSYSSPSRPFGGSSSGTNSSRGNSSSNGNETSSGGRRRAQPPLAAAAAAGPPSPSPQVVFPAAPISPAHLGLVRGNHNHNNHNTGQNNHHNTPFSHHYPLPSNHRHHHHHHHASPNASSNNNNNNQNHRMLQARQQEEDIVEEDELLTVDVSNIPPATTNTATASTPPPSLSSPPETTSTTAPTAGSRNNARTTSSSSSSLRNNNNNNNSNSLGELLRRHNSNNNGSNHGSGGGGTSESAATGSNRSTDTAATATIANHATTRSSNSSTLPTEQQPQRGGSEIDARVDVRPLATTTAASEAAATTTTTAADNRTSSIARDMPAPSTAASAPPPPIVAPSLSDVSSNTPSPPRLLRPALSTQPSLRTVVPSNDPHYIHNYHGRRLSVSSNFSYDYEDDNSNQHQHDTEFFPRMSRNHEWMGRSIESLILGHGWAAPMLALEDHDHGLDDGSFSGSSYGGSGGGGSGEYYMAFRRRSTASTFGGAGRRRSSQGAFPGGRRGSLSLVGNVHGGTLANYFSHRRRQQQYQHSSADYVDRSYSERMGRRGSATTTGPMYRRRSSMATSTSERSLSHDGDHDNHHNNNNNNNINSNNNIRNNNSSNNSVAAGPNIVFSILARETTGKANFPRGVPASRSLRAMGGAPLFAMLDKPAGGIATEVAFLAAAIDIGDWSETHQVISRLTPRLTGDPLALAALGGSSDQGRGNSRGIQDASLPPTAPKFYAGGGRLGLERDAFCLAGGVPTLIRIFREKSFVGQEMALSYDARDLSEEIVSNRLAAAWNEALVSLRELVYAMPALVENGTVLDNGDFLPFLFTLLAHDSCFEAAAALIEEILSLLSQAPQQASQQQQEAEMDATAPSSSIPTYRAVGRVIPATTFYLGNVPDLYRLWRGFNCRQLAHFCRILALLVFEPEDRQSALSENAATTGVMKSIELLQLRRNRTIRAGRDSTVDMNQAILLGDGELLARLLKLLRVTNFAPSIRRFSPYHVMAHNPFIVDTLLMLGFSEFENWGEVDRQDLLARDLMFEPGDSRPHQIPEDEPINDDDDENDDDENDDAERPLVSQLGTIADWLENLSETLSEEREPANQLLRIMTTAQRAGLVVGSRRNQVQGRRRRRPRRNTDVSNNNGVPDETAQADAQAWFPLIIGGRMVDGTSMQGLASFAGMLTDQVLVRRLYQNVAVSADPGAGAGDFMSSRSQEPPQRQHHIQTPLDAANSLQFNAMILGPYQVEILFVLCTFLGGKRKLDAQDQAKELGLIPVMEEMFERLPWFHEESSRRRRRGDGNGDNAENSDPRGSGGSESSSADRQQQQQQQQQQPTTNGIHGPGCECTPESALCVQYLRLLHNFCDRDCDNYEGRQLLLSSDERAYIFGGGGNSTTGNRLLSDPADCEPGLLSKIIRAFINESDESPYRFWLASCIESYLRGSSAEEQVFMAKSGLLQHLVSDVSSERLHCAGSLQTSFDLLGELGKGNVEVFRLLVSELDEESFRKLMGVAATNLVDSNVFIRSLLLSLERLSAANYLKPLYMNSNSGLDGSTGAASLYDWNSVRGSQSRSYLTHTWWDTHSISLDDYDEANAIKDYDDCDEEEETSSTMQSFRDEEIRPSDWFPSLGIVRGGYQSWHNNRNHHHHHHHPPPPGLEESVGYNGWLFTPAAASAMGGDFVSPLTHLPNSIERLSWFLAANQGRLLRDLLGVVDLRNINHENICCLNTAVVIAIFAHRRQQLASLLQELRQMNADEQQQQQQQQRIATGESMIRRRRTTLTTTTALQEHEPEQQDQGGETGEQYARSLLRVSSNSSNHHNHGNNSSHSRLLWLGDENENGAVSSSSSSSSDPVLLLRNFRQVLWFWREYYTHRGRDRLSLEFSSHLRFQEWDQVVSLLGADDGSALALVPAPIRLPRSPYQRSARGVAEPALLWMRGL